MLLLRCVTYLAKPGFEVNKLPGSLRSLAFKGASRD